MVRGSLVGAALGALLVAPLVAVARLGGVTGGFAGAGAELWSAALVAVEAVGFVIVPQTALAVAVLGLAVHRMAAAAAGLAPPPVPGWLAPAVESALLLGMLGTIAGMVRGFAGLSPESIDPGPLIQSLGAALRSSFVGFGIALVGVWLGPRENDAKATT